MLTLEYRITGRVGINGGGLENSRKFNKWGFGIIGGLDIYEIVIIRGCCILINVIDFRCSLRLGKIINSRPQNFGKLINGGGVRIRAGGVKNLKN